MKKLLSIMSAALVAVAAVVSCGTDSGGGGSVAVEGVKLNHTEYTFTAVGETVTLVATVEPGKASDKRVIWSSKSNAVATVSDEGVVTAVENGTTSIRVSTMSGGRTADCVITVNLPPVLVESVSLDKEELELDIVDSPVRLKATVLPEKAADKRITWGSSNPAAATVNDGVVTPVAVGETIITVTTEEGKKIASCTVKVINDPAKLLEGSWVWDQAASPHWGTSPTDGRVPSWDTALRDEWKADVYDDVLTFNADKTFKLDTGPGGKVLVDGDATTNIPMWGPASGIELRNFVQPADSNWGWAIVSKPEGNYLTFSGGAFPSYIPNRNYVNDQYEMMVLNRTTLYLRVQYSWGCWYMRFTRLVK